MCGFAIRVQSRRHTRTDVEEGAQRFRRKAAAEEEEERKERCGRGDALFESAEERGRGGGDLLDLLRGNIRLFSPLAERESERARGWREKERERESERALFLFRGNGKEVKYDGGWRTLVECENDGLD